MIKWPYFTLKQKFLIILLFSIGTILFNFKAINKISPKPEYKTSCDFKVVKYVIETLCDLYNKKTLVGNMCSSLCNPKNQHRFYEDKLQRKYELVGCYNGKHLNSELFIHREQYSGVKTILVYEYLGPDTNITNKRFVLKSRHPSFLDFGSSWEIDVNFKEKKIENQLNYLLNEIRSALFKNFGISIDREAINSLNSYIKDTKLFQREVVSAKRDLNYYVKLLSGKNFNYFIKAIQNKNKENLATFISNLLVLLSQEEYLFYSYFKDKPESLKISGTCGNFYAVEHAESLKNKIRYMDKSKRFQIAKQFLDLVVNLDKSYLNGSISSKKFSIEDELASNDTQVDKNVLPLQMCDLKLNDFGLNSNDKLKIIDTDMIKSNSYLFQPKFCNKHDDCAFFECKGFCEKNHCIQHRVNNNLQSICQNILYNTNLKEDSLILNSNQFEEINPELLKYLNLCKSPGFYKNSNIQIAANESLARSLYNSLY